MPSTVTGYYTFVAGTKARASQVNANFANHRGDLLPINENTASASDMTHYNGQTDHRWLTGFFGNLDLKSSTTTAGLILRGDTALTAGAFKFDINSITVAKIGATGMDATWIKTHSIVDLQIEDSTRMIGGTLFTASGTYIVPTGTTYLPIKMCGGGGGGGGGGGATGAFNGGGGGGGAGALPIIHLLAVTAGDVLSITVGAAGSAGGAGTDAGAAGPNGGQGGTTIIVRNAVTVFYALGGLGGVFGVYGGGTKNGGAGGGGAAGGTAGGNGTAGSLLFNTIFPSSGGGGGGAGDTGDGAAGANSPYGFTGGTGGTINNAGMGGGGGAGEFSNGGAGANSNGGTGSNGSLGSGGGGGGGNDHAGGHVNGGPGGLGGSGYWATLNSSC